MPRAENKAVVVAGMAYGDEAKGATVDFLCRDLGATLVVRYNGGHQAAHNVVLEDGRHHTFSQFGSGTLIPGVRTHLSRFMLVSPQQMMVEEEHLRRQAGVTDAFSRLTVDEDCVVVTPYHRAFNRLEEIARGDRRHGSCGVGIGCARRLELDGLALRVRDLGFSTRTKVILEDIKDRLLTESLEFAYRLEAGPEVAQEADILESDQENILSWYRAWLKRVKIVDHLHIPAEPMVFEGAQGVLLDETYGTAPYNTWTNTTFENALTLLKAADFQGQITKLGCWRSYFTRHGAGPFPTESKSLLPYRPESHNSTGRYQGAWRVGEFDYKQAARAVEICGGIDEAAISHMDMQYIDCEGVLPEYIKAPVTILGYGPRAKDRARVKLKSSVA